MVDTDHFDVVAWNLLLKLATQKEQFGYVYNDDLSAAATQSDHNLHCPHEKSVATQSSTQSTL